MQLTSMTAIYILFWVISAFVILPLGIRSHQELDLDMVEGQADGAPGNFRPLRVVLLTTLLATTLFGLFYLNYLYGWLTIDHLDVFGSRDRL